MDVSDDHKFHDKFEISYYQYLKDVYEGRVALIREFERIFGKEETHRVVEAFYSQRSVASCTAMMDKLEKKPESTHELREFLKKLISGEFMEHTQTEEWLENDSQTIEMMTTECLYAEVFKDLEATDIGTVMLCNSDFATAPCFHPRLKLKRSKTIMRNDSYCDFKYVMD